MEIIGTNQEEKDRKTKKTMKLITIIIVMLLVISIILFITIYYLEGQLFKFYIDDKKVSSKNDLFVYEGDTVYVSLEDIAPMIGYKYYNSGYKQYSEDTSKGYLEGENEVCTFEKDSNIIYKTPVNQVDYEYFTIDKPVIRMNKKLYITAEGLSLACNIQITSNQEQNRMTIYTLPYLANYYTQKYNTSAVATDFKNQKALLYGLMIIQNIDNTDRNANSKDIRYGIYKLGDKEIVGTKYTDIEFIESTQEFIVKTPENKVGIITADGDTKVSPQYDSLKQIDKDLNLYLVTNNNKKGVIEKNGKILIYLEYDEIGIDATQFQNSDIKNPYLLFNNAIPVKQNGKWGMYDKKGNIILPIEYDGLGCITNNNTSNSTLIIPDIKGIVVSKITEDENRRKKSIYGIVNYLGKSLVVTALENVYYVINNGREEYTMVFNGTSYNVIEYMNQYVNLEELNDETKSNNKTNTTNETTTNVVTNTTTNVTSNTTTTN